MTLKAFDGRTYKPCGIINNLHVELGEKQRMLMSSSLTDPLTTIFYLEDHGYMLLLQLFLHILE